LGQLRHKPYNMALEIDIQLICIAVDEFTGAYHAMGDPYSHVLFVFIQEKVSQTLWQSQGKYTIHTYTHLRTTLLCIHISSI